MRNVSVLILLLCFTSCGKVKRSAEIVFNRYKVSTPSMSPALNVGDICSRVSTDSFRINDLVFFHPPQKYQFDNPDVLYIFRLVGLPGDSLAMKGGRLFLNKRKYPYEVETKHRYLVETSMPLNENRLKGMEYQTSGHFEYLFQATPGEIEVLRKNGAVTRITSMIDTQDGSFSPTIFNGASVDTWGPLRIPKKGDVITITESNLPTLEQLIPEYENGTVPALGGVYTFQKDYYFVLGDNRHNALDSRFIGFIPEDQIAGVGIKH